MSTADQDAWLEVAHGFREGLRKRAELLPAMTPEEVKTLIEAARTALWLEQEAATFDAEVRLKEQRVTFHD